MSSSTLTSPEEKLGMETRETTVNSTSRLPSRIPSPLPQLKGRSTLSAVIIVITATSAMIINNANTTAMSIALPTMQKEWNLGPSQLQWPVSAYSLSSGCLYLVLGRLADLYGRKKIFCAGCLMMSVFSLACGFAPNILALDILRAFQGVGAAAAIPAAIGILAHSFPPSRARSLAFATFAAGAPIGAAIGTTAGGVLTQFTSKTWRSSFYLITAVTVLCFVGGLVYFDKDVPSGEVDKRVDWIGVLLVTAGLVLIVFVLGDGEFAPKAWRTPYIIICIVLGIVFLAMFIYWQYHLEKVQATPGAPYSLLTPPPLMKLSLWTRGNGRFSAMMVIAFMTWSAFISWTFWVQLYYQDFEDYTPILVVIRLLPMFVSGIVCNLFVGFMAARVPVVFLLSSGAFCTAIGCLLFAVIDPSTTYWAFGFPASVVAVVGADFVFAAGTLFISRIALPHEQSVAGGLFSTMTQLGTAFGVTVTTIVSNSVSARKNEVGGIVMYRTAQWTAFAFGIVATLVGIVFFRGVGVVGVHVRKDAISRSTNGTDEEKGRSGAEVAVNEKQHVDASVRTSEEDGPETPETIVIEAFADKDRDADKSGVAF
ncbi:MFS general substrate transporter [Pholiota conissans]|uniref:MFS general substrate transporter n=1 Tax=Pholiota conissans TaxID=109636 RepID=A0A9P6D012_9AGAR|nr:MFS general substrate transporter [Pholiota conissans]